jgi:CheY-like chemotaxis protein
MNAIVGFSELLNRPGIEDKKRSFYVDIIRNSSNRLLQIIDDILDISKLEAKQLTINPEECNLFEIFNASIVSFRKSDLLLSKPDVELILNLPPKYKDLKILSDKNRLQQVLDNLINNAIKYTDKGVVETGFEIKEENSIRFAEIYIKDTGKGIPKGMNDLIFERFRQIEEKGFHEGAGLGLSISKGIVELWGGKIWFTSKINKGTTFFFSIPLVTNQKLQDEPEIFEDGRIDLANKTILIAEDDYNSFLYLQELLEGHNVDILYAENGEVLMNILESKLPDLIFLDINMPVKSGLRCLKEIQKKGLKTKIIMQTAYAMTEEKERCLNMGCQGYISKPIKRFELYKVISQVMKNS